MTTVLKPNPARAQEVLKNIDELIAFKHEVEDRLNRAMMKLATCLLEAHRGAYWIERGYSNEHEWIAKIFPQSRSQYYDLISIAENLGHYPHHIIEQIGRTKAGQLVKLQKHFGVIEENYFLHAMQDDCETFIRRVKSALSTSCRSEEDPEVEVHYMTFRFVGDQIFEVKEAIKSMEKTLGSDKSSSEAIRMMCIDWMAGYREDGLGNVAGRNGYIRLLIDRLLKQLDLNESQVFEKAISLLATWIERSRDADAET